MLPKTSRLGAAVARGGMVGSSVDGSRQASNVRGRIDQSLRGSNAAAGGERAERSGAVDNCAAADCDGRSGLDGPRHTGEVASDVAKDAPLLKVADTGRSGNGQCGGSEESNGDGELHCDGSESWYEMSS